MVVRSKRFLSLVQKLFHDVASKSCLHSRDHKTARWSRSLVIAGSLLATSSFGADRSFHAEWGYPGQPENTSGFTFFCRLAGETETTAQGSVSSDVYSMDFWWADGKRFYASVAADFSDGTHVSSAELPVLSLDGNVLLTIPSGSIGMTLPTGQRLDVMMDTADTYVNGLVTTAPSGYVPYDNGVSRYYGNHFEQLFINKANTSLLVYPVDDFTGESAGAGTNFYYSDTVNITGYARHTTSTAATALDSNGVSRPIYAVVIVQKPAEKQIGRINYTASSASDYKLQRITPYLQSSNLTWMDAVDREMTKHNFYLDPNGDQWYGSVNATGRKMRIRKWTADNVAQQPVDIDFDNLVVSGASLGVVPQTQKIFKYVRQIDGTHLMLALVDGGAIVSYELDATGSLVLTSTGTDVKKRIQGPFAGGLVELIDIKPAVQTSGFNLVWRYPTGVYSIWKANQYAVYSSYFRVYPEDYASAQLSRPDGPGPYYEKLRVWPLAKKRMYYAWGKQPPEPAQAPSEKSFLVARGPALRQRIVPLACGWNFGETIIARSQVSSPMMRPLATSAEIR